MDRRRPLLEISIVLGLIALVGALATLQYRWLGQVTDAERARLHVSLEQRANEFATDLDREITRTYMRFQSAGMLLTQGDANGFATQFDEWSRSPQAPLVRDVFRLTKDHALEQYRRADRRFVPVAWPPELQPLRSDTLPRPAESFLSALPAMVVPLPAVQPPPASDVFFTFHFEPESLVLWFDREYLTQAFLPALADRHFSAGGTDVRLAIVDAREPSRTLFTRGVPTGSSITPDRADVAVDIAIRPELADPPTGGPDAGARMARTNIYLERRTNPGSKTIVAVRSLTAGRWRLLVQPAAGSLDTLVAGQRRRNLMLSFGMLVLLAVSVGILLTIARRSQRLATQQMEFVATISHELRTPLAVIRSAAQNLSAGVIDRPDQARRYGELIDGEGRRLGDMVEQILQFAGLSAPRSLAIRPVNVAALIRELVASCEPLCRDARVRVDVDIDGPAPLAAADPESLRTALQNLVANAIKHGASGGWVRVAVCTISGGVFPVVRIDVADGGRGISAEDLPHVFEPFYRGRYAVDRQLRGNGLGLALVKRIAEAHRGAVSVQSAADHGATFTLDIPAASTLHDRPAHQVAFS